MVDTDIVGAMERLVTCIDRDVNGVHGMPMSGNGGLVSNDTIRASDEARLALHRHRAAAEAARLSNRHDPAGPDMVVPPDLLSWLAGAQTRHSISLDAEGAMRAVAIIDNLTELCREVEACLVEMTWARDAWKARESATQAALQEIGETYGLVAGTPRTDGIARLMAGMDARIAEMERAATKAPVSAFDIVAHLHRQRAFSLATFGPGMRTRGVCDHIRKELVEIEADPEGAGECEWIDVIILAFDGALRSGLPPEVLVDLWRNKQALNETRQWPDWRSADPDKAIEHVRTAPSDDTRAHDEACLWDRTRLTRERICTCGAAVLNHAAPR